MVIPPSNVQFATLFLERVIAVGAINEFDIKGNAAIHYAVEFDNVQLLSLLISEGAEKPMGKHFSQRFILKNMIA